jgi:hypothetical protein
LPDEYIILPAGGAVFNLRASADDKAHKNKKFRRYKHLDVLDNMPRYKHHSARRFPLKKLQYYDFQRCQPIHNFDKHNTHNQIQKI